MSGGQFEQQKSSSKSAKGEIVSPCSWEFLRQIMSRRWLQSWHRWCYQGHAWKRFFNGSKHNSFPNRRLRKLKLLQLVCTFRWLRIICCYRWEWNQIAWRWYQSCRRKLQILQAWIFWWQIHCSQFLANVCVHCTAKSASLLGQKQVWTMERWCFAWVISFSCVWCNFYVVLIALIYCFHPLKNKKTMRIRPIIRIH